MSRTLVPARQSPAVPCRPLDLKTGFEFWSPAVDVHGTKPGSPGSGTHRGSGRGPGWSRRRSFAPCGNGRWECESSWCETWMPVNPVRYWIRQAFRPHFRPPEGTRKSRSAKDLCQVGARGFEPPTSRSRTVRSSHAELRPVSILSCSRRAEQNLSRRTQSVNWALNFQRAQSSNFLLPILLEGCFQVVEIEVPVFLEFLEIVSKCEAKCGCGAVF